MAITKRSVRTAVAALAVAALSVAARSPGSAPAEAAPSPRPWLAPGLSTDQRVDRLLAAMTLDEKIAELHADNCPPYESCVPANPRLGLPELVLEDDSTGVAAGMQGVTALPATIGASASWDPNLTRRYGAVIGAEERDKGIDVALAPTVNIARVPEWGRNFESLGEDPYLSGQIGSADVQGMQSQGIVADVKHFAVYNQETNRHAVSAQVSSRAMHEIYLPAFAAAVRAGAGSVMASYNGINGVPASQNPDLLTGVLRNELGFTGFVRSDGGGTYSTVPAADAGLDIQVKGTDYFAAPLKAAVEDGQVSTATINSMVAPILRTMFTFHLFDRQWGNGTTAQNVITPADTQTALDAAEQGTVLLRNQSGQLPLRAGSSVAVIGPGASPGLAEGSGSGNVVTPFLVSPVQGIRAADAGADVSYAAGLPASSSLPAIPSADLSPAYRAGKSYNGVLTPETSGRYLLSVHNAKGYNVMTMSLNGTPVLNAAGTADDQYGSAAVDLQAGEHYSVQITGPSDKLLWATPDVRSAAIDQAVAAAKQAQAAVVVVGAQESEAVDRIGLGLPGGQDDLVSAVAAANPHTIVVLNNGGPVLMPWLDKVPAVVEAWFPGEHDGTALADVLFGQVNPSGKLPMTFPASDAQVPASTPQQFPGVDNLAQYSEGLQVGYRWYDTQGQTPLFPFGFGLSYTTFAFSDLAVSPGSTTSLGTVQVSATVTNTGTRAGAEVAQLYLGEPATTGEPPRQLKGFQKVSLAPGRSTRVHFSLTPQDISTWDGDAGSWTVAEGNYQVMVGDSSADLPLYGSFRVAGTTGDRAVRLDAPPSIQPGRSATVTATLAAGGDLSLHDASLQLSAPSGWQLRPLDSGRAATLGADQPMTARWQVTAPATAPPNHDQLTATATFEAPGHGSSGTEVARTQVEVQPLVTATLDPASVTVAAGQSGPATLSLANTSGYPLDVSWTAQVPSGVSVTPASGTVSLEPGETSSRPVSVGAPSPGSWTVPVEVDARIGSTTVTQPGPYLSVTVLAIAPYRSGQTRVSQQ
jgi:beta-glucosidase